MAEKPATAEPKRCWYQFRLRTLLILISLLAIPVSYFGVKLEQGRRQRAAIETISRLGGTVHYDYEVAPDGFALIFGDPPGPQWLRDLLGIDFFASVAMVDLPSVTASPESAHQLDVETCLRQLRYLPDVKNLGLINSRVSDDQLRYLESLTKLEKLWLNQTSIGDAGLKHLTGLRRLTYLILFETQVSDAGLADLQRMGQLRDLVLSSSKVSRDAIAKLRVELPNCRIDD